MAISPRVVTQDVVLFWDGVFQRLPKGQVMDVPPGSALEWAIGREHLVPLPGSVAAQPPAQAAAKEEPAPKEEPKSVPKEAEAPAAKPAPVKAKAQDDDAKDGAS